jgi:integrase
MAPTNSKKAKNGTGTIAPRRLPDGAFAWWARITLPDGRRPRIPLKKMSEAMAKEKAAYYSEQAKLGILVFDVEPARASAPGGAITTVREFGEAWTSGGLLKTYGKVNRLRVKAGAEIDQWCLRKNVYEVKTRGNAGAPFGDLPLADVTEDDVGKVMAAQPPKSRAETLIKQYNRLHRLFDLAIFPLRARKDNPVTRYLRPEPDADKLFCFLYPTEMLALLRGRNEAGEVVIPLGRRVLYALATYTGQRKGSLYALRWKHADFDHGTLASFKTKTGRAQYFVADRGLMAVLKAWRAEVAKVDAAKRASLGFEPVSEADRARVEADDETPIVRDVECKGGPKKLAKVLRADLKAVGVKRALLFEENAENVEPLRFHDLRSTFCTWARRAQKSDVWISERTGQDVDGKMISRYDRGAQTLGDLGYEPFPDIARAVPELPPIEPALATALATTDEAEDDTDDAIVTIPGGYIVGAIGIEPTTPTVSR